ncbi:hypothetical protein GW17_00039750 [Ensete ventricosum]|nr:hypothetical protein GW17_00039750 [Ensete ventricosum]
MGIRRVTASGSSNRGLMHFERWWAREGGSGRAPADELCDATGATAGQDQVGGAGDEGQPIGGLSTNYDGMDDGVLEAVNHQYLDLR